VCCLNKHIIVIKYHAKLITFNPPFKIMIVLYFLRIFSIYNNVIVVLKLLFMVFFTKQIVKKCLRLNFKVKESSLIKTMIHNETRTFNVFVYNDEHVISI
jgi:hypothetical protein